MTVPNTLHRMTIRQFAERFKAEMIPLGKRFSYFCAAVSLNSEDLKEYLDEPVAALPAKLSATLPQVQILLVPYLKLDGAMKRRKSADVVVSTERPEEEAAPLSASAVSTSEAVLAFAVKETEVADYHYRFYRAIAELAVGEAPPEGYVALLREEIGAGAHGEVDEGAWRAKVGLQGGDEDPAKRSKRFFDYARQSFVDTLTLYLHGLCCDIDVEPGPRQLASNLIRKRLRWLRSHFPPPEGYAVLPEDVKS